MNKNLVFLIAFFLQFTSLPIYLHTQYKTCSIPEPDIFAHEIMDNAIATLAKKYNLNPCGIGMNGKFEYLEISFQTRRSMEQDEIRAVLLDCTDVFLNHINSCEKIRQYLKDYPFTNKNTGIVLYISDENNNDIFHPEICCASIRRNAVSYSTTSQENTYRYKETTKETYEQALDIVKKQISQKKSDE